jgi:predicted TPR repeat methyltransferase
MPSIRPHAMPQDPLDADYLRAEELLARQQLKEAAAVCQAILQANPLYHRGYFLLSKLFSTTGNTDKSLEFIERAIELSPEPDPTYFYLRGNGRLLKNDLPGAEEDFKEALAQDRSMALAALLLGTTYVKMGRLDDAEKALLQARKLGLKREAAELLGILEQSRKRMDKAEEYFKAALAIDPTYALGYVHLGNLSSERSDWDKAKEYSHKAMSLNPNLIDGMTLQARIALRDRQFPETIALSERILGANPHQRGVWLMLAHSLKALGQLQSTMDCLQKMLEFYPDDTLAISTLVPLMMATSQGEHALPYVERALAIDPQNKSLRHFHAILNNESIEYADHEYVASLFDGYAEDFDYQLREVLKYRTPEALAEAVQAALAAAGAPAQGLALLDLGCGTGLGAEAVKSLTTHRVGIDLSPQMLEKAKARSLYDHLEAADILEFLQRGDESFDLILSSDVFVYIGRLDEIFRAAHARLNAGGHFAFSVEQGDDAGGAGYTLRHSGRFAHARGYIEHLAQQSGFQMIHLAGSELRLEAGKPIMGYLVVLRKI